MAASNRVHRVEDLLQRILAECLQREIKDPRLKQLTISEVQVSKDLSFATVYVSSFENLEPADLTAMMKVLQAAKGVFRHKIAEEGGLRIIPDLRFIYDNSSERGSRIEALLHQAFNKS